MSYILDRLIIISLSVYLFFLFSDINSMADLMPKADLKDNIVIALLILLIVVSLLCYFDSRRNKGIVILIYSVAAIFVPSFAVLSPVVIYDIYGSKFFFQLGIMVIAVINGFRYYSMGLITGIFFLCLLACVLNYKTTKNDMLNKNLKKVRDDGEEKNLLLAEKNKSLIEKQDGELNIATLRERNRIAREIHDNVGHMLTRSILQMGALMTIYRDEPLNSQLSSVKESLDTAMNNVRESVHDLHDESIDLKNAVNEVAASLKDRFEYKLEYDMSQNIESKYKYAIIGIVKEAVSNIIKYSSNSSVDIILREHPAMFQIIIQDYSKDQHTLKSDSNYGLHNNKNREGGKEIISTAGIGLQNMRDRVDALNGNITITDNSGYKIFVTLPKKR